MLNRIWRDIWTGLDCSEPPGLLDAIRAAYAEPWREYHTAQHLQECLLLWDETRQGDPEELLIALALYFHDAVYDPRAPDNEARSADWAARALGAAGVADEVIARIVALILATRTHDSGNDPLTARLLDIDLAILGSDAARFAEYERQIRAEYGWISSSDYREGRGRVLRGFLERPAIFQTPVFFTRFEQPARRNLAAALAALDRA